MAASDVEIELGEFAHVMRDMHKMAREAQARFNAVANQMKAMSTQFSSLVSTVGTYTGKDAFEVVSKAKFDALVAESDSLLEKAAQVVKIDFNA